MLKRRIKYRRYYELYRGLLNMMILVNLGQRSYNFRTTFPKYSDSVLESSVQRTLSQRDKLTSIGLLYHSTAMPSSAGG